MKWFLVTFLSISPVFCQDSVKPLIVPADILANVLDLYDQHEVECDGPCKVPIDASLPVVKEQWESLADAPLYQGDPTIGLDYCRNVCQIPRLRFEMEWAQANATPEWIDIAKTEWAWGYNPPLRVVGADFVADTR